MKLREYRPGDCREMAQLFYDTVHFVNRQDYTPAQLNAWADGNVDLDAWDRSFREHYTLVAEVDGKIAGFGDMDRTGYLDRLYVHRDCQGRGIATALCDRLEQWAKQQREVAPGAKQRTGKEQTENPRAVKQAPEPAITTHASVTARPFFEKRGYRVVREQQVERKGQLLTNYVMVKKISNKR